MKNLSLAWRIVPLLVLIAFCCQGQNTLYQLTLNGTCSYTNAQGKILQRALNNTTLIRDLARANGTTNYGRWALAYHLGGAELGDTIEIIDRSNGATLKVLFGLFFGSDFGRMGLLSAGRGQMKRIEYVYTDQNSHSLGSALLTTYFAFDAAGRTNKTVVLGQMQYVEVPDATHYGVKICSATFRTTDPWRFPNR